MIRPVRADERAGLLGIWARAVDATHDFLTSEDRREIEALVADWLVEADLLVAVDGADRPLAFMGLSETHIDALFVEPAAHGRGIGRALVEHAGRPATVDVNEQNAGAVAFYRRLGFVQTGRSDTDDGGRPYPLLFLRRD